MTRLGIRRRLLLVVVATVGVAVAALVAAFNVILVQTLDRNARDLARSRAQAEIGTLQLRNGQLSVGEVPNDRAADASTWVYSQSRVLERPRAGAIVNAHAKRLDGGPPRFATVGRTDTLLYAQPIVLKGKRMGTIVAAVSLAPYEQTRDTALLASLVFGFVMLVLVGIAARWALRSSLQPVVQMTRQAAAWSEDAQEHRFALGEPYDELTELGATLDTLLDRLAASLRHERRFSAELSHELRTPLARILAETELALRRERTTTEYREALSVVQRSAAQLARIVDALVAAARYESGGERGTADARAVAEGAAYACDGLAAERAIELQVEPLQPALRVGVDADLGERILQPVIENACRYGRHRVRVSIERDRSTVVYAVEDDGPGVAPEERERIFEPGARGKGSQGAGLGLALARRLAESVDGEVLADENGGGGRFLVRLPAA
jgi:signal transduction histidine kinase